MRSHHQIMAPPTPSKTPTSSALKVVFQQCTLKLLLSPLATRVSFPLTLELRRTFVFEWLVTAITPSRRTIRNRLISWRLILLKPCSLVVGALFKGLGESFLLKARLRCRLTLCYDSLDAGYIDLGKCICLVVRFEFLIS